VINGHKSAAHTDSPDGSTGKTCLGRGMHCSSASSFQLWWTGLQLFMPNCLKILVIQKRKGTS